MKNGQFRSLQADSGGVVKRRGGQIPGQSLKVKIAMEPLSSGSRSGVCSHFRLHKKDWTLRTESSECRFVDARATRWSV